MAVFCPQPQDVCLEKLTQGDIWDAQKDMIFAVIGSVVALILHNLWGKETVN